MSSSCCSAGGIRPMARASRQHVRRRPLSQRTRRLLIASAAAAVTVAGALTQAAGALGTASAAAGRAARTTAVAATGEWLGWISAPNGDFHFSDLQLDPTLTVDARINVDGDHPDTKRPWLGV